MPITTTSSSTLLTAAALVSSLGLAACGGGSGDDATEATTETLAQSSAAVEQTDDAGSTDAPGVRVVSALDAAATIDEAPAGLVILDIRTPEEFSEAHIEDAALLDFYRTDFADELAKLDRDVPYVLYCRSGNRSSQARAMMTELGFTDVEDIVDGIVGWQSAGLPTVTG